MTQPRVLVVSQEPVGPVMAGPAIRAYELARALAGDCRVTLAAPAPSDVADPRVAHLPAGLADYDALLAAVRTHDVVVAQVLPPRLLARIWPLPARLVVDLYNPTVVEVLEATRSKPAGSRARVRRIATEAAAAHLAAADLVLCAAAEQRALWTGVAAARGGGDDLAPIAVVPFGVPEDEPRPGPAIRAAIPAIGERDRVLLWNGGIWNWLDAPTAIHAAALLDERTHLVFLGRRRPALAERDVHRATSDAVALARQLGLEGRRVHFNDGWVPYAERGAWLLEADLGVSAHADHLETRFAFRTRLLDCLWARLPVVATAGDPLGNRIAAAGAGRTVAPGDAAAFAAACAALLDDPGARAAARAAAAELAGELRWDRAIAPLRAFCHDGAKRPVSAARRRAVGRATRAQYAPIARETLSTDGAAALARRLGRNAARLRRKPSR